MEIKFLGGCQEIGRSSIAVKFDEARILLDYGALINHKPEFPSHIAPRDVDAIVVTHAHLDHSGMLPIFYLQKGIPIYGTKVTFDFIDLLISDFLNVAGYYLPYELSELRNLQESAINLNYDEEKNVKGVNIKFINAGHIPGSVQVILKSKGSNVLYTSDLNLTETRLLHGATIPSEEFDVIIIESTYPDRDHPDRKELEERFVERLREVAERGGTALIPSFSVGRAQEILMILEAHQFPYPVALDGMAIAASKILAKNAEFLKNAETFFRADKIAKRVKSWKERSKILKEAKVIVSPAGMLKGGPAVHYMHKLAMDEKNAIFLVSYQILGTPGRELLDNQKFTFHGISRHVKAEVRWFDFSSHCGRTQLLEYLKSLKGSPEVFVVHGEKDGCNMLAESIKEELGFKATAPAIDQTFKIGK